MDVKEAVAVQQSECFAVPDAEIGAKGRGAPIESRLMDWDMFVAWPPSLLM